VAQDWATKIAEYDGEMRVVRDAIRRMEAVAAAAELQEQTEAAAPAA